MIQNTCSSHRIPWPPRYVSVVDTGGKTIVSVEERFHPHRIDTTVVSRYLKKNPNLFSSEPDSVDKTPTFEFYPPTTWWSNDVKRQFCKPRSAPSTQASFRNLSIELRESQAFRKLDSKFVLQFGQCSEVNVAVFTAQRWRWFEPQMPRLPRFRDGVWKDQELRPGQFGGWYSIHFNTTSYHQLPPWPCPRNVGNDAPAALLS